MKIAVYDTDTYYAKRICSVLSEKYKQELELVLIDEKQVEAALADASVSVCILPESMRDGIQQKEKMIMYFTENRGGDEPAGNHIFKYVKPEQMKDLILTYYKREQMYTCRDSEKIQGTVITFMSLGNGMGNSTVAAGIAKHFAMNGKKPVYINLRPFHTSGHFETQQNEASIEQMLADISVKGGSLLDIAAKMHHDASGVLVLRNFEDIAGLYQMSGEQMRQLLQLLSRNELADVFLIDLQMENAAYLQTVWEVSDHICFVLDGSSMGNQKMKKVLTLFSEIDPELDGKVQIIFNGFKIMPDVEKDFEKKVLGGIRYVENAQTADVLHQISSMSFSEELLK